MLFSHRKFDYHRVILAFEFNHNDWIAEIKGKIFISLDGF